MNLLPMNLLPFALGLTAVKGIFGAYTSYKEGELAAKGAKTQAEISKIEAENAAEEAIAEASLHADNALIAEQEAQASTQATIYNLIQHKRLASQMISSGRARVAKSGVTQEGSPLKVLEDTASQLALEHALIAEAGVREAGRFRSRGLLDIKKSEMAKMRARNYLRAGRVTASGYTSAAKGYKEAAILGVGTSLLSAGSEMAYMKLTT